MTEAVSTSAAVIQAAVHGVSIRIGPPAQSGRTLAPPQGKALIRSEALRP
jgi:hypothetical protein